MVITRTVEMHAQLVGYDFKKKGLPTDKNIAVENSKVSNDYFWKTNKYTDQDVFGRTLDLTALINKPDGYLKGSLSDTEDVDYYEFNITEYRALSFAKDTYNRDITITLDHIPEGCDYEMVLYDEEGNQVGIGKENGNGGLSITIPNWNSDNRGYTVKVQAKNGSTVNPDAEYHLSFQTTQADKSHGAYQEMAEVQKYEGTVRKQMQEGLTDTEETRAIKEIRQKYKAYYTEQMEKLHQKQAEDVMQGGAVPDDEQIHNLLEKKAAGGELTEQENALLNIFCTAAELDSANSSAKMNTTVKDRIFADLQEAGIDISDSMFSIKIGADGQVSVDGINDNAMKQKIEDVLSKYSDDLMDIYFSMDSEIQALSDKEKYLLQAAVDVEKFLYKATGGSVSLGDLSVENTAIHGLPKTLDDLLNNPGDNLTYQDYASDIREILAYNRTQHKDIMSELNVQFVIADGTFQIKD
ncbi:MAG: prepilin peptidase dependent protein A [Agathobacter rectalis]